MVAKATELGGPASGILETCDEALIVLDAGGCVIYANSASEGVLGQARTDAIGHSLQEALAPLGMRLQESLRHALRGRTVADLEDFCPATHKWIAVHAAPSSEGLVVWLRDVTERRLEELTIAAIGGRVMQDLSQIRAVLESMTEGLVIADPQGNLLYHNPASLGIHGYPRRMDACRSVDTYARKWAAYDLAGHELDMSGWPIARALAGERFTGYEVRMRRRDGSREFVGSFAGTPVLSSDGRVNLAILTFRDITEHKRAEEQLRASEERLRQLSGLLSDFAYSVRVEPDGRCAWEWITGGFERMTGYPPYSISTEAAEDLAVLEDRHVFEEAKARVLAGEDQIAEYRIRTRDGTVRWVRSYGRPIRDGTGRVVRILGAEQDITERKSAAIALERERAFLRRVIDTVPSLVFVKDWEGRFVLANEALARCYGTTSEAVIGRCDADYNADAAEVAHFLHDDREVMQTRQPRVIEQEKVTFADGTEHWMRTVKVALLEPDGSCRQVLGVAADITARKHAEEALEQAKVSAEAANAAKDRFLAVLSHELRTPLTPVLATAAVLSSGTDLPIAVREDLELIQRNVELEARLIDDLLDLTRITQGKLHLSWEVLDIEDLVQHTLETCWPDIKSKDLAVRVDIQAQERLVRGDAARLQQVLWNLLRNAIKFTPDHGHISIRATNAPALPPSGSPAPPTPSVTIAVTDTGVGIEPELLPRMFDAFQQGGQARQFGGLGLGLAISRTLAELHGGRLTASSAGKGQGATFAVTLPTVREQAGHAHRAKAPTAPQKVRALRILLVEDHLDTARTLARLLRGFGHAVTIAHDVRTGVELAGAQPFDLIVSDLGLPDGTGLDLLRTIRRTSRTPAIALTGFGMEEDVRRSFEAGFMAHVTKPVNIVQLEATIQSAAPDPAAPVRPHP